MILVSRLTRVNMNTSCAEISTKIKKTKSRCGKFRKMRFSVVQVLTAWIFHKRNFVLHLYSKICITEYMSARFDAQVLVHIHIILKIITSGTCQLAVFVRKTILAKLLHLIISRGTNCWNHLKPNHLMSCKDFARHGVSRNTINSRALPLGVF